MPDIDIINEPDIEEDAPDSAEPYLTTAAVSAWIAAQSDHALEQIWRSHNYKAQWVPTIKYPPGFNEKLQSAVLYTLRNTNYHLALVRWLGDCRKIWSIQNAAKFVVRLAYAEALSHLIRTAGTEAIVADFTKEQSNGKPAAKAGVAVVPGNSPKPPERRNDGKRTPVPTVSVPKVAEDAEGKTKC